MNKVKRSITIDADVDYQLRERPYINVSALCNEKLREYLEKEKQQNE